MQGYKNSYLLILCLTFGLNTYCQDRSPISYSISAGVNASEYKDESNTPVLNPPPKAKIGGSFSALIDIPIYKCLFLRTGISYLYLSSEFSLVPVPYFPPNNIPPPEMFAITTYTNFLSTNNICIPVLIKISSKKASNNMYIAAGIDAVYNIYTSLTTIGYKPVYPDDFIFSTKKNNSLGIDYAIVIGKYFHIYKKQFFVEIQYNQDITNWNYQLTPLFNYPYSNPTLPVKNYSASIVIGWVFK